MARPPSLDLDPSGDLDRRRSDAATVTGSTEPSDAELISLTLPHDERFLHVARLVVGGLAARLDLPFESLDDLQLAVETVLSDEQYATAEEVTVEVRIEGRTVEIAIGPLDAAAVEHDLAVDDRFGLGTLLAAVVDGARLVDRRNGHAWLRLEKLVPRPVLE